MWKRSRKKLKDVELWNNTEIPLYNWEQLNETNDLKWLIVHDKDRSRGVIDEAYEEAYFNLYDDYANLTNLHAKMDKWRELVIMRMEARLQLAQGDKSAKNWIEIFSEQIKNLMKKDDADMGQIESRMAVQQAYGQRINPREISLKEYLSIIKLLEKQSLKARSHGED